MTDVADNDSITDSALKLPGCGENLGAIGLGIYVRLTGEDTNGACVAGKVKVELDHVERVMTPGSSMLLPRGVPHMFANPFDEETRIVAVVSPGGLENYYKELSELPPGPRDMTKVAEIMKRHGLSLVPRKEP